MAIHTMTNDAATADYAMDELHARTLGWDVEKHGPLYMQISYEGCVLDTGEMNWYDDSDFYAVVWSEEKQAVIRVTYGSTRGWSYSNHAEVDATDEVRVKATKWLYNVIMQQVRNESYADARKVVEKKEVVVVKGRKLPIGTVGVVTSIRFNEYDKSNPIVMLWDGKTILKTYMKNVEVVNPEQYELTEEEFEHKVQSRFMQTSFRSATAAGLPVL